MPKFTEEQIGFMREAIKMSSLSLDDLTGGPFGSVIVKNGNIIAKGRNMVLKNNDPSAHGEVSTIRIAGNELGSFDLSGCDLYTNCEPCPMCLMTSKWANIQNIYYSATRKDASEIGFRDDFLYDLCKDGISTGIFMEELREEARRVMLEWKRKYNNDANY